MGFKVFGEVGTIVTVLVFCFMCIMSLIEINSNNEIKKSNLMEAAYMTGQLDILKGNKKIVYNKLTKCWSFRESPWASGKEATYENCEETYTGD